MNGQPQGLGSEGVEERFEEEDRSVEQVALNLQRLRAKRYLSLDGLARLSGVSRAMLAQIESGRSVPSIKTLCKVARALKVSVAAFLDTQGFEGVHVLPAREGKRLVSADGALVSRALFPVEQPSVVEFHELRLAALGEHGCPAQRVGVYKNLVVSQGVLEVSVNETAYLLSPGDAVVFYADQPHRYRNPADSETLAYLVVTQPER
ncbi:helix-turn-helix domain-containing protein [Pseudomonas typographi]|uniref:Helix-turn-helix domain-containing protein n=1 Tax=Pseudomonas typographi TaxID=2715964 RepID=A0ABR7YWV9_9PSED|nr:XRE family transcriptional regulator [Pseudomonas typographi]MBD1552642.1 helix-turn-helix domain-containing protein [Pseudomonas typographi]MBD1586223.1 helix-turn-helix domain-containing protein [Pseudomonas typographi]MBD1597694.1 helix-turn-helix domain-containing protein [Pseudomonas typographi]